MISHLDAKAAAARIVGMRVKDVSKKNYAGKLNTIKLFLLERTPDAAENQLRSACLDVDGTIIVPLDFSIIEKLFGWLSVNTDLPKRGRRRAVTVAIDAREENDEEEENENMWFVFNDNWMKRRLRYTSNFYYTILH
jgi:hypothetical protein